MSPSQHGPSGGTGHPRSTTEHHHLPLVPQFQTFLTQINSSLVDSNMLVRCIVLSLDRFENQTEDVKGNPPTRDSTSISLIRHTARSERAIAPLHCQ